MFTPCEQENAELIARIDELQREAPNLKKIKRELVEAKMKIKALEAHNEKLTRALKALRARLGRQI